MKTLAALTCTVLVSVSAFAKPIALAEYPVSKKEKTTLIASIKANVMVRALIQDRTKLGAKCRLFELKTVQDDTGIQFTAQINCQLPDTDGVGGGATGIAISGDTEDGSLLSGVTVHTDEFD